VIKVVRAAQGQATADQPETICRTDPFRPAEACVGGPEQHTQRSENDSDHAGPPSLPDRQTSRSAGSPTAGPTESSLGGIHESQPRPRSIVLLRRIRCRRHTAFPRPHEPQIAPRPAHLSGEHAPLPTLPCRCLRPSSGDQPREAGVLFGSIRDRRQTTSNETLSPSYVPGARVTTTPRTAAASWTTCRAATLPGQPPISIAVCSVSGNDWTPGVSRIGSQPVRPAFNTASASAMAAVGIRICNQPASAWSSSSPSSR
jgi:hypothetical protein